MEPNLYKKVYFPLKHYYLYVQCVPYLVRGYIYLFSSLRASVSSSDEPWEWVSAEWLSKWLANPSAIDKVENKVSWCPHNKLLPEDVIKMKCITSEGVNALPFFKFFYCYLSPFVSKVTAKSDGKFRKPELVWTLSSLSVNASCIGLAE